MEKTWARVRAGTYKNDLCFVEKVEKHSTTKTASNMALIKLVPRLDYQQMASREKAREGGSALAGRPWAATSVREAAGAAAGGNSRRGQRVSRRFSLLSLTPVSRRGRGAPPAPPADLVRGAEQAAAAAREAVQSERG